MDRAMKLGKIRLFCYHIDIKQKSKKMSLSEIKDRLYKKDGKGNLAENKQENAALNVGLSNPPAGASARKDAWGSVPEESAAEQKKFIKIGAIIVGVIAFLAFSGVAAYKLKQSSFSEDRVAVAIDGPGEAKSGRLLNYEITFRNDNRVDLKDAVLKFIYPESFKPEEMAGFKAESSTGGSLNIGTVKAHDLGKMTFSGRVYSPTGTLMYLKAELVYAPSNFNSQFSSKAQLPVNIISSPITLEIMAPQNVSSGDSVDYLVSYKNESRDDFDNVRIRVEYPEGFTFSGAVPKVSEGNNTWYIGNVAAGKTDKIVISGKLEGNRDEMKTVKAYIGSINQGQFFSYSEESAVSKIVTSPLSIAQTVNGLNNLTVNAGDTLYFEIGYKNNGDRGYRDVIVTEKIDSPVLDYTTLNMEGGAYDANNKTITWKASDYANLRNLEPGQIGVIKFNIKVKNIIPVAGLNDKNFVISSIAKIDSPDIPTPIQMNKVIAGNKMDIKLNSKIVLDVKGYYNDATIQNSGPIPPKVGNDTTYTLHWRLINVSNDLAEAKVEAFLPTGAFFTGKKFPEDANLTYNERTNTLAWDIGNMAAGEGILNKPREVSFQVKITPAPNQAGFDAKLLNQSTFSVKDLFTGEKLTVSAPEKSTQLTEDSGIGTGYKVVAE